VTISSAFLCIISLLTSACTNIQLNFIDVATASLSSQSTAKTTGHISLLSTCFIYTVSRKSIPLNIW